jgi:hypothetical protein
MSLGQNKKVKQNEENIMEHRFSVGCGDFASFERVREG